MRTFLKYKPFSNRRCVVIGSAPNPKMWSRRQDDYVICIKGSGHTAAELGIFKPNLTIIPTNNRYKLAAVIKSTQTEKLLHLVPSEEDYKLRCKEISAYFKGRCQSPYSPNEVKHMAKDLKLERDERVKDFESEVISWYKKVQFKTDAHEFLSMCDFKETVGYIAKYNKCEYLPNKHCNVSFGMAVVIFALYSGASEVVMVGINPNSLGHSYSDKILIHDNKEPHRRLHIEDDISAIEALRKLNYNIVTSI